jgi:hypothetical protein
LVYHARVGFGVWKAMRDSLAVGDVTLEVAVGTETPAASCIKTYLFHNLTFLKK